ncbi:unnamed protein product, partial [Closterium sp. NIES-54]
MAARIASKSRSKIATPDLSRSPQRGISVASGNWVRQASVRRRKQCWVACWPPHCSPVRSPVRRTSASTSSTSATTSASSTPTATATAASTSTAATEAPTAATEAPTSTTIPTPTPSSASTATTATPTTSSSTLAPLALAVAVPLTRSRRSADRLGANKVDSSSRGNGGQKRDGGAPLKERGTGVTTRGSYSGNTSLCCNEALLEEVNDNVSLFDHTFGASLAPPATADSATRSQWLTRDAAARLAIRNHLPLAECAHFGQHKTAKALYDVVVARYSSPATAALGRLLLPYLFPEVSAFATIEDLVTYLRTSDARYRAALPADFLDRNPPPMYITLYFIVTRLPDSLRAVRDHFLALDPTNLTVDLLKQHLLVVETSVVAIGAARGTPRTPFFEGCSPSPLAPSYASTSASGKRRSSNCKGGRRVEVAAGVVVGAAVEVVEVVAAVGVVARVGALVPAMVAAVGVAVVAAVGVVLVRVELFRGEVLAVASGSSN